MINASNPSSHAALMLHVERIVRPLGASPSRGLRMRRELLAHLQAALEEERRSGISEAESLDRALRRLGDPDELRRTLQGSIPRWQRWLLWRVPAPGKGWDGRLDPRWRRLSIGQSCALCLFTIAVMWIAAGLLTRFPPARRQPFFDLQTAHPLLFLSIWLGIMLFQLAHFLVAIKLIGATLKDSWRQICGWSAALASLYAGWALLIAPQLAGTQAGWIDLASGLVIGLLVSLLQAGAVRLLLRRGNPLWEWRSLRLAD